MVDVTEKKVTRRSAIASARVVFPGEVHSILESQQYVMAKGSVIQTAVTAGIMGAKRTPDLIPMCHPLPLGKVEIRVEPVENGLNIECEVALEGKTGVEMEALTGASVAALTVYDMCKSLSHSIIIDSIRLVEKKGGKSDVGPKKR